MCIRDRLMSLPIIGASGSLALLELAGGDSTRGATLTQGLFVALIAFIAAYVSIAAFMKFVTRIGMFPFMIYRVLLGVFILLWLYGIITF